MLSNGPSRQRRHLSKIPSGGPAEAGGLPRPRLFRAVERAARASLRRLCFLGRVLPLVLATLATACSEFTSLTPLEQNYGAVAVKVTDERGAPVAGVRLELRNAVRRMAVGETLADGIYEFEFIPPESYLINATPPSTFAVAADQPLPVVDVAVVKGEVTAVPIRITDRFGSVQVRVVDSSGSPVEGVGVELRSALRGTGFGFTDGDGVITFGQVPPESYLINLTPPAGYTTADDQPNPVLNVGVEDDQVTEVGVTLREIEEGA